MFFIVCSDLHVFASSPPMTREVKQVGDFTMETVNLTLNGRSVGWCGSNSENDKLKNRDWK